MLIKARLKKAIKAKAKKKVNIGPATEAMIELVMQMFIKSLAEQATARAFEEKSATIRGHHVRAVSKKLLKKSRG